MQRAVIMIIFLITASGIAAQTEKPRNLAAFDYKRLHWGFTVGLNAMDYAIVRNETYRQTADDYLHADVIGFQPAGFQVNVVSDLRLSDYWNLRFLPGINLGSRQFVYFDPDNEWQEQYRMTVGASFLDFPLLLKYRSDRVNNYRPYVIGGLSYRLDMSAKGVYGNYDPEDDDRIIVKKSDLYLEVGFGVDQYLKYFKYSTELKLAIGLRNMIVNDKPLEQEEFYTYSISELRSFIVMLNFHFE